MLELLRTNDIVLISRIEALLDEVGIHYFVADANMSVLEGSIALIQRRILVLAEDLTAARRHMTDIGLAAELPPLRT
jgi:hypothetical protein